MMKASRNTYRIFVGKPLGKLRMWWENNIKKKHKEIFCEDGRWLELA
jgi:hypothetical protein